jgi:hypothetical protein
MKKILFVAALLLPKLLFAQYNYMTLNFGLSHPLNHYSANNNLSTDGFAYNGLTADYTGAYYLSRFFGFAGDIKYTSNTTDHSTIDSLLQHEIPLTSSGDTSISYQVGIWKHVSFLVGPQLSVTKGNFSVDVYALAGLSIIMNPPMGISVIINDQSFKRTTSPEYARFGFDVGASLRYKLNENYGIRIYASYFQSSAKGKIQDEVTINTKEITVKSYSTKVQTVNIGLGLIYVLD